MPNYTMNVSPLIHSTWKVTESGAVPWDFPGGNIAPVFKKGQKGGPQGLLTHQLHLCAQEGHGTDAPRSCAKAHGGQGDDSGLPEQLRWGQSLPDQTSDPLWWTDHISGQGTGYRFICTSVKPLAEFPTTSLSLIGGKMDLIAWVWGRRIGCTATSSQERPMAQSPDGYWWCMVPPRGWHRDQDC